MAAKNEALTPDQRGPKTAAKRGRPPGKKKSGKRRGRPPGKKSGKRGRPPGKRRGRPPGRKKAGKRGRPPGSGKNGIAPGKLKAVSKQVARAMKVLVKLAITVAKLAKKK